MRRAIDIRRAALQGAALALAVAAAYHSAFTAGFVYDDHTLVEGSRLLRGSPWRLWVDRSAPDYWPLTATAFWLERRAFGGDPAGYHAVNVALHACVALLLWRALRKLDIPGAWLAALLFALHPVAVESVAWIAEQKNTLSAIFFLATILVWARPERRTRDVVAALALFTLALLAKASVVMLPVLLLAISWHQRRGLNRRAVEEVVPFFGVALAIGLLNLWFQHRNAMAGWASPRGVSERVGGAGWALASYLETAFVPVRVAVTYPKIPVASSSPLYFVPLLGLVAALVALWVARARWPFARPVLLALLYHAAVLLPVIGIADMAYLRIAPVANHLQYLALMGAAALTSTGITSWSRRAPLPARASAAVLAIAFGLVTASRAAAYENDLTLWTRAVEEAPDSTWAHEQLSMVLLEEGRRPEALHEIATVARLARDPATRHRARALAAFHGGEPATAAEEARAVLRVTLDPDQRRDAAWLLTQVGASEEAAEVFAELSRRAPGSPDYAYWLGAALARSGRLDDAANVLRTWCRERPGDPRMEEALAFVLLRLGRPEEARPHAASMLGAAPDDPRVDRWLAAPTPVAR